MTKIEEEWTMYRKNSWPIDPRDSGYGIAGIWTDDVCSALSDQGMLVDRDKSTRQVTWDHVSSRFASFAASRATVPLDTAFPSSVKHRTEDIGLRGTYGQGEKYELALSRVDDQRLKAKLSLDIRIEDAQGTLRRFKDALTALENLLRDDEAAEWKG